MRNTALGTVVLATTLVLSGCASTERSAVDLGGDIYEAAVSPGDDTVVIVEVPTCDGHPEVTQLHEQAERVTVEVVSTKVLRGDSPACLDNVEVQLERPLGDRELIDRTSGRTLRVRNRS